MGMKNRNAISAKDEKIRPRKVKRINEKVMDDDDGDEKMKKRKMVRRK